MGCTHKAGQLPSVPGKVKEQILLQTIYENIEEKKHAFMKGKSYFTNLIAFYDEITSLVLLFGFSKAFDPISHNNIDKFLKYKLDEYTERWAHNRMKCKA